MKRLDCSVKGIKDEREKDYLHAFSQYRFFPERGFLIVKRV